MDQAQLDQFALSFTPYLEAELANQPQAITLGGGTGGGILKGGILRDAIANALKKMLEGIDFADLGKTLFNQLLAVLLAKFGIPATP